MPNELQQHFVLIHMDKDYPPLFVLLHAWPAITEFYFNPTPTSPILAHSVRMVGNLNISL